MNSEQYSQKGFKSSAIGPIPCDWEIKELGKLGSFIKGKGILKEQITEKGLPCVRYGEIYTTYDFIIKEINAFISEEVAIESQEIHKGDILFAGSGETIEEIGKAVAFMGDYKAFAGGDVIILSTNGYVDPICLSYFLETDIVRKQKRKLGQGHSVVHIYPRELSTIKLPFPPLPEQTTIAICLSAWDKAISAFTALIYQKELRKMWLMQQLLTGKKRLKGFGAEWKEFHLGEMFSERTETRFFDLPLLSVGANGIYPQSDSTKKDSSNDDKSKYKRICPGDIGYNTMRMWQGRSSLSNLEGIVSPAYTIVKPKVNADSHFFSYLFKTRKLMNLFLHNSQGLVDHTLN